MSVRYPAAAQHDWGPRMLMQLLLFWASAAMTPPTHLHRECSVMKPDGQPTVVRLFAQDEWIPLEGTRWWVQVGGHFYRLDSYGFESNYGPLYQSPEGNQVIAFRSFRNTVGDGLRFDLVTAKVTEARGEPATFEAEGWKLCKWQRVDEGK
jgi:hypothetical protein